MSRPQDYYSTSFFEKFRQHPKTAPKKSPKGMRSRIEELFGIRVSDDLGALVEHLDAYEHEFSVGNLCLFDAQTIQLPESGSDRENSFLSALEGKSSPFLLPAIFTFTLPIGVDGEGNVFYAQVDEMASEVFFQFHEEEGIFEPMADSLPSFIYAQKLEEECWAACYNREILDTTSPVDIGHPSLKKLREELNFLSGKINFSGELIAYIQALRDIDRLAEPFEDFKKPTCEASAHIKRAYKLIAYLKDGRNYFQEKDAPDEADLKDFGKNIKNLDFADKLYWMWYLYFFSCDEPLKELIDFCLRDNAILIKDAARLIQELLADHCRGEIKYLRALRDLNQGGCSGIHKIGDEDRKALLKIRQNDSEPIQKIKKVLSQASPLGAEEYWGNVSFGYYLEKDWEKVHQAADIGISINRFYYYNWLQKGIAYQEQKEFHKALGAYDKAIALTSFSEKLTTMWINKGLIYTELKDKENAFSHFKKGLALSKAHLNRLRGDENVKRLFENDGEFQNLVA